MGSTDGRYQSAMAPKGYKDSFAWSERDRSLPQEFIFTTQGKLSDNKTDHMNQVGDASRMI